MDSPAGIADPIEVAVTRAAEWFSPVRMMDVEITEPLPTIAYNRERPRGWVVGRLHTEPVGVCVVDPDPEGLTPDRLGALLWGEIREPVTERFASAGLPPPPLLTGAGLQTDPATWPYLRLRQAVLHDAPFISVIVPTRDREERRHTWLDSLRRQEYPRFEVVVVDNAPTNDAVRTFVDAAQGSGMALRYVREPRPGTSWAANAGVAASAGEIVTFCPDDGEPDRHWLTGLACGFARGDDIGCVTAWFFQPGWTLRLRSCTSSSAVSARAAAFHRLSFPVTARRALSTRCPRSAPAGASLTGGKCMSASAAWMSPSGRARPPARRRTCSP